MTPTVLELIQQMNSPDADIRLRAVEELGRWETSQPNLVRWLGRLAVNDPEPLVSATALRVLALPPHLAEQRTMSSLTDDLKASLLPEIQIWEIDGVITPAQAELLRNRLGSAAMPDAGAAPGVAAQPHMVSPAVQPAVPPPLPSPAGQIPLISEAEARKPASFSQLLLSETSIKVALFLGAFFVLAAAVIVMALVEVSRIPILAVLTAGFFIVALLLGKRLPLASQVLYVVAVLLLPILGSVVITTIEPDEDQVNFLRAGTALLTGLAATAGALRYRSRWLIVLGWLAFVLAAGFLITGFSDLDRAWLWPAEIALALLGVLAAAGLFRRDQANIASVLGISAMILVPLCLTAVVLDLVLRILIQDKSLPPSTWLAWDLAFWFGLLACLISYRWVSQTSRPRPLSQLLAYLAAICLLFAVPLAGGIFQITSHAMLILTWIWGVLLFLGAELLYRRSWERLALQPLPLSIASLALILFSGLGALLYGLIEELDDEIVTSLIFFSLAALIYLGSALLRFRALTWSAGLVLGLLAYTAACFLPAIERLKLFGGLVFAIPAVVFGLLGSLLLHRKRNQNRWWLPSFILSGICGSFALQTSILSPSHQGAAGLSLLLLAFTLALVSGISRLAWIGYGAAALLAVASLSFLRFWDVSWWYLILTGLAGAYCLAGILLQRGEKTRPWSNVACISGAALAAILAISQLPDIYWQVRFQNRAVQPIIRWMVEPGSALPLLLLAACLARMAWRHRQVWLGYLASASLAGALAYLLVELHVPFNLWCWYFTGLALVFTLAGWALESVAKQEKVGSVLVWSGLGTGSLVALSAYWMAGKAVVLAPALAGALFAVQALRKRNVWLGFPTGACFFIAYTIALRDLEITEPQYYSIGAAVLGLVMHFLLLRRGQALAAVLTGLAAQMILLSTTYIQLIQSEKILFFYLVFFQALILIVYGLVVRSRSFVIVPVVFVVVTVITVTFSLLKGLPTALLIGGTGLLLLSLGIVALLLRERVQQATERLGRHLSNW